MQQQSSSRHVDLDSDYYPSVRTSMEPSHFILLLLIYRTLLLSRASTEYQMHALTYIILE
jgi:hypothetical protein